MSQAWIAVNYVLLENILLAEVQQVAYHVLLLHAPLDQKMQLEQHQSAELESIFTQVPHQHVLTALLEHILILLV